MVLMVKCVHGQIHNPSDHPHEKFEIMATKQKLFLGKYVRFIELEKITKEYGNEAWVNAVNTAGETPVHVAARYNNLQLLKSMLPHYTDIETTDNIGNTALHVLADHNVEMCVKYRKKRVDFICYLISKGADVNKRNRYGWTLVHFAAKHCHIDMLKILKKNAAALDLQTMVDGTALLLACKYMFKMKNTPEEKKTIDYLVDRISDINAIDEEGYSALHYAAERCSRKTVIELLKHGADVHLRTKEHKLTPLHFAIQERNLSLVKIFLDAGAMVECQDDIEELTPLHMSILEGSWDVIKYLINNGADVNKPDKILQLTPLQIAIYQQRCDLFQLLIDKGADINGTGKDGLTPLHLSSMLGCPQFTKALIHRSAEVNCRSNKKLTPLHVATIKNHLVDNSELIEADAIKYGHKKSLIAQSLIYPCEPVGQDYDAVIQLLLRSGADVNALTTNGWSSLHFAAELNRHNVSFVKILLEYGANINLKEPSLGFAALHFVSLNNFGTLVEILVNAGADMNALTEDGKRPVHLALLSNSTEVLKLLLDNGANVDGKETQLQLTALHLALYKNYSVAAEILINAGADVNAQTQDGKSPLHLALESNNLKISEALVEQGATLNCQGKRCLYTFLYIAAQQNDDGIIDELTDWRQSLLFQAVNEQNDKKINKAIFRLCALVDAFNTTNCMPVNPEVEKCCAENFGCLRICGVGSGNYEAYNKFISYRILSGTFHEFNNRQIKNETNSLYLSNYLFMLNAVNLPLTSNYETIRLSQGSILCIQNDIKLYHQKCLDEVEKLKRYLISDEITLYNVLHMRPYHRWFYTKVLDLFEIKLQFEIYYKLILSYYYEDKIKSVLRITVSRAFYQLTNVRLPIICLDKICWELGIIDIIAVIESVERIN